MADETVQRSIVLRQQAKALGLTRYFTGKPCRRGHISMRAVGNSGCVQCMRQVHAEHYQANREIIRNRSAEWYRANTERALEVSARWKVENPDRRDQTNKAYYEANKPRIAVYKKNWTETNRERVKLNAVQYVAKNKLRIRANHLRWRQANPEKLRVWTNVTKARRRGADGKYTSADIIVLFKLQRGKCAYCRVPLGSGYHIDHILPISKGGSNWPANLQLTCVSCNCSKHALDPIIFARKRGMLL